MTHDARAAQPGEYKTWAFVTFAAAETVAHIMSEKAVGGLPFPHLGSEIMIGVEFPETRQFSRRKDLSGGAERMASRLHAKAHWSRARKITNTPKYLTARN